IASPCLHLHFQPAAHSTAHQKMHSAPWPARESTVPQSPENHGRDRFPSSSCLRPSFHEALLFIPAVAVWAAGGESVLPHKVGHAARLAHGVVQTAQGGGQIVQ